MEVYMKKLWIFTVTLCLLLTACSGVKVLSDDDAQTFAEKVAPVTENLLTSLSEQDEAGYTQDMEPVMKEASSGKKFTQTYNGIIGKLGQYKTAAMTKVFDQKGYRIVVYTAEFENETGVTVRVVFDISGADPKVTGLWLDSPKLREK